MSLPPLFRPASVLTPSRPASSSAASSARRRSLWHTPALEVDPLAGVPSEIQALLWSGLVRSLDASLWERVDVSGQRSPQPEPPRVRQALPPIDARSLRALAIAGLRRLLRLELRLAVKALEAWVSSPGEARTAGAMLAAHCTRAGQVYTQLQRRLGACVALPLLGLEFHLLATQGACAPPLA